jgi:hypothetical protein
MDDNFASFTKRVRSISEMVSNLRVTLSDCQSQSLATAKHIPFFFRYAFDIRKHPEVRDPVTESENSTPISF